LKTGAGEIKPTDLCLLIRNSARGRSEYITSTSITTGASIGSPESRTFMRAMR